MIFFLSSCAGYEVDPYLIWDTNYVHSDFAHQEDAYLENKQITENSVATDSTEDSSWASADDISRGRLKPLKITDENEKAQLEAQEKLKNYGDSWFYGGGMGRTAANIGTTAIFPPYGLYLLTNAGLSLTPLGPLYFSEALPKDVKDPWNLFYENVTSIPGRLNAAVARRPYVENFQSP